MSNNKFYITTSIAYANAAPHIGYAMESLQADALARFHRMKGEDVFYLSGTDENGSKIKKTALEKEMSPQEFVDENSAKFQLLFKVLDVSNDYFVRTTDQKRHWPAARMLWKKLVDSGDIYKANYEGYYCVGCEAYLTEKDLVDGKCPNHQKEPEKIKEENYFFRLSKYSEEIKKKIESGELDIVPESRKNEILNVITSGLRDISFSRPKSVLDWGIPIPGDDDQTMYVWCDALTNYISAIGYADKSAMYEKYWPADVHVIGKDILRFHAAIWPGMLLSAGLPLPKKIFVHGFITSGGQKMSKSVGNVIDPFAVVDKYKNSDALRYYLLKEIPSMDDGDFTAEKFEEVYAADLQNGLGNFVSRTLTMIEKYFDGYVPPVGAKNVPLDPELLASSSTRVEGASITFEQFSKALLSDYESLMNKCEISRFLSEVNADVSVMDRYINKYEPFKLVKTDKEKVGAILYNCAEFLRILAWSIWPFMPQTSNKIFAQLLPDEKEMAKELNKNLAQAMGWGALKTGMKIKKGENLFPRFK